MEIPIHHREKQLRNLLQLQFKIIFLIFIGSKSGKLNVHKAEIKTLTNHKLIYDLKFLLI